MKTKLLLATAITTIGLTVSSFAMAKNTDWDKVQQIESELFVKHQELIALQNAQYPDAKAVGKKAEEIAKLNNELYSLQKDAPRYRHGHWRGHWGGHCNYY